jgi:hypothetical protein
MWSAGLWDLRGQLGGNVMDRLVLEAHFLLGASSTFFTATQSLITADTNVNAGANATLIRRRMIQYGLTRLLTNPAAPGATTSLPVSLGPNRDAAGNYASDTDETQTVTVPGARGLLVHFTRVDLESNRQCFQTGCDNIYLTNGAGDLFQVLSGTQADITSVAIVGDTVHIRLVSDPSQVRFGYHVDRVEVLDAPADAGVFVDGGIDVFDGGTPPPPFDAGMRDAGVRDGGTRPVNDAGSPVPPLQDAGMPQTDAGVPPSDGGTVVFTRTLQAYGNEELRPALNRGCGCGATSGLEAWAALGLLGLLNRRRR